MFVYLIVNDIFALRIQDLHNGYVMIRKVLTTILLLFCKTI